MKRVFVIHGRQKLQPMHDFLTSVGLDSIHWEEGRKATGKPNPYTWDTVVKLVEMADIVVGMLTPDDEVRLRSSLHGAHEQDSDKRLLGQARPNVLIEIGYAMGKKEGGVILIQVGAQHRPLSDLWGHHIPVLNNSVPSRSLFLDALDAALGESNKLDRTDPSWQSTGDFGLDEDYSCLPPSPFQGAYEGVWRITNYKQVHQKLMNYFSNRGLIVDNSLMPPESGKANFMITTEGFASGQLVHGGRTGVITGVLSEDGQFAGTSAYPDQPSTPIAGMVSFDSHGRLKCEVFQRVAVPQLYLEFAYAISSTLNRL